MNIITINCCCAAQHVKLFMICFFSIQSCYLVFSQNECSVNHSSGADERNTTDADDDDKTQNKTDDTNNKEVFGRFSKRNYRRRTESESSTSSVSMTNETPQEQNNDDDDDGINSNQNDREVKIKCPKYSGNVLKY